MRKIIWILFGVLAVLHQDFWLWNESRLVFGFLPIGLAYHIGFSLAAATLWALASRYAWPTEIEALANGNSPAEPKR
jgi:hypothetical protein